MTDLVEDSTMPDAHWRAAAPELCRVSIVAEYTQMDIALPARIPVAAMLPELVALTLSRRNSIEPQDPRDDPRTRWTLRAIGEAPLDSAASLAEQGVRDGALLLLGSEDLIDSEPLFDDVIDAVSTANAARFPEWGAPASRLLAQIVAIVAAVLAATMLADPLGHLSDSSGMLRALISITAALGFLAASPIVARIYRDPQVGATLGYCVAPFAFVGGALLPQAAIGGPGLLLGAVFTACASILALRMSGAGQLAHTAIITVSTLATLAAGVDAIFDLPGRRIGVGLLLASVAALSLAPRLTILLARLPLPPVPSRDVPADLALEDGEFTAGLADRAAVAAAYLSGLIAGAILGAIAGALLTAGFGADLRANGVCLALLVALTMMLRGRSYSGLIQSALLISGGTVLALLIIGLVYLVEPQLTLYGVLTLVVVTVLALAVGVVAPTFEFSPVLRRITEVCEYLAIAAIIPLAFWVMGLYSLMRQL
ncbi:type VII secretion integral membrane protein EccD [Tomitella biformata]|uniref:type VII secretion integral membrane protein EccD n=1 Tax=Tomitella biformata TaxID=630403 RepID=UPI000467A31C|nr:type VII secretion integral membrane protein EccD [Tomitella biformata]